MMRLHHPSWEQLQAIPEGEWVYLCHGLDAEFVYPPARAQPARVVVPITARAAASLSPWPGEILEARVKGKTVEWVRRRSKASAVGRTGSPIAKRVRPRTAPGELPGAGSSRIRRGAARRPHPRGGKRGRSG